MDEIHEALSFALAKYPHKVEAVPIEDLVMDSARGKANRPAYVKLAVPDEMVKALRGSADRRQERYLLVSIPQEVLERSSSSIILPGEM